MLTLRELEAWQALEVAKRYHHSEHHGLTGATPASAWEALTDATTPRRLPGTTAAATRFLIHFLPMARRTIQNDGLTLFYIRYWHPIFVVWRTDRRSVSVRYHPEDLSRVFVSAGKKDFIEVRYADLRRGPISLFEQRAAVRLLRAEGRRDISELHIFKAIEDQRRVVTKARNETLRQQRKTARRRPSEEMNFPAPPPAAASQAPEIDYSKPAPAYNVEQW